MEFNEYVLKDISLNITDGVHNTVIDDPDGDCFLLSCKNIKDYHIVISANERTISHDTLLRLRNRTKTEKDDILITSVGTIGELALIKDNNPNYEFQRSVAIIKPNKLIIIPEYLMYSLRNEMPQINSFVKGAVQKCLFINDLKQIVIKLPSLSNQNKIVQLLTGIDRKIELNNQINNNLYEILETLYKNELSLEDDVTKIKTLDEYCNIFTGKKNANEYDENGENKFFTCGEKTLKINSYIYDGAAIIISGNGSYTGRTMFYNGKFDLYQRTYACTPKSDELTDYIYALYIIIKKELTDKIKGGTHGSAIPYIVMNDLAKFKVMYSDESIKKLSVQAKVILDKILQNDLENQNLEQLRDTLLPKLMNGEIDLNNIEI